MLQNLNYFFFAQLASKAWTFVKKNHTLTHLYFSGQANIVIMSFELFLSKLKYTLKILLSKKMTMAGAWRADWKKAYQIFHSRNIVLLQLSKEVYAVGLL